MSNVSEKIKKLAKIEYHLYVLGEIKNREWNIKNSVNNYFPMPHKPEEPRAYIREYPKYDEKAYRKKAKDDGAGETIPNISGFLFGLGFKMIPTLIGAFFCWIPILIALLLLPFSIGHVRRKAHKIYVEECEEIKKKNEQAKAQLENYNRAMAQYNRRLAEYQERQNTIGQKNNMLAKKFSAVNPLISKLRNSAKDLYSEFRISGIYQNFISAHIISHYLETGAAATIPAALESYKRDEANGIIPPADMAYMIKYQNTFQKSVPQLVSIAKKCNEETDNICKDLSEYIEKEYKNNYDSKCLLDKFIDASEELC